MEKKGVYVEIPPGVIDIAKAVRGSHPNIVDVRLFGSYTGGSQKEFSDIDIAILVDKESPVGYFSNKGPVARAARASLENAGMSVGKGPGEVDIEVAGSGILELNKESAGIITRAILEGRSLFLFDESGNIGQS